MVDVKLAMAQSQLQEAINMNRKLVQDCKDLAKTVEQLADDRQKLWAENERLKDEILELKNNLLADVARIDEIVEDKEPADPIELLNKIFDFDFGFNPYQE